MKKNRGFVISTMLYSVFGIMLLIIFYILYMLTNNRMSSRVSIDEIKNNLNDSVKEKVLLTIYVDADNKTDLENKLKNILNNKYKYEIDYSINTISKTATTGLVYDKETAVPRIREIGYNSWNSCNVIINNYLVEADLPYDGYPSDQTHHINVHNMYTGEVIEKYFDNFEGSSTYFYLDKSLKRLYVSLDTSSILGYWYNWNFSSTSSIPFDMPISEPSNIDELEKAYNIIGNSRDSLISYYTSYGSVMDEEYIKALVKEYANKVVSKTTVNKFIKYNDEIVGIPYYTSSNCIDYLWLKKGNVNKHSMNIVNSPNNNYDKNYFVIINKQTVGDILDITSSNLNIIEDYDYSLIYTNSDLANYEFRDLTNTRRKDYTDIDKVVQSMIEYVDYD